MKRYATLIVFVLMLGAPTFAQSASPQAPSKPAAAQDEFVPVTGAPAGQETIPATRLVGIAYGFIWVVLFAYVWSVRSRLSTVEREIEAVSKRVPARK